MRVTVKIGLLIAAAWIALKMFVHYIGFDFNMIKPMIFSNMFFALLAVAIGLYFHKKQEGFSAGNYLSDIKAALTSGAIYSIVVSAFLYFYYDDINPNYNRRQIEKVQYEIDSMLNTPDGLAEIRKQQAAFEVKSKEEIRKDLIKGPKELYKASTTMYMSLLAMFVLSTFYSIMVAVIYRNVLFRENIQIKQTHKQLKPTNPPPHIVKVEITKEINITKDGMN